MQKIFEVLKMDRRDTNEIGEDDSELEDHVEEESNGIEELYGPPQPEIVARNDENVQLMSAVQGEND